MVKRFWYPAVTERDPRYTVVPSPTQLSLSNNQYGALATALGIPLNNQVWLSQEA